MFGDRVKKERVLRQMTQKELSKLLGVSPSTVGMYEQNRRQPDSETIIKLSKIFNVSTDYLLGRTDIKNPSDETPNEHKEADEFLKRLKEEMIKEGIDFDETSVEELIETYKILKQFKEKTKSN